MEGQVTPVREWPGMRSEYARVRPHAGDEPTTTRPGMVGIAFSGHRGAVYESAGRARVGDIPPGATIVSGGASISWLRVREVTEALEVYPDPALLRAVAGELGSRPVEIEQLVGVRDATVLGIGSVLRRAHARDAPLTDVAASTLAHRLADHLLTRYAGLRPAGPPRPGLLPARTVDRVADVVESGLPGPLRLEELAAVAHLSPYHFARAFARTTGLPPHRFVTSRRMDRARLLLSTSDRPVDEIAQAVGFANRSHFRRVFRDFHGVPPGAVRAG